MELPQVDDLWFVEIWKNNKWNFIPFPCEANENCPLKFIPQLIETLTSIIPVKDIVLLVINDYLIPHCQSNLDHYFVHQDANSVLNSIYTRQSWFTNVSVELLRKLDLDSYFGLAGCSFQCLFQEIDKIKSKIYDKG